MKINHKLNVIVAAALVAGTLDYSGMDRERNYTDYTIMVHGIPVPLRYQHNMNRRRTQKQAAIDWEQNKYAIYAAARAQFEAGARWIQGCETYAKDGYRNSWTRPGRIEIEVVHDYGYMRFMNCVSIPDEVVSDCEDFIRDERVKVG